MLPVLMGLGALAVGFAVVKYWDEIINWLSDLVCELKRAWDEFKSNIAHAAAIFIKRVADGLAHIAHKIYYKENRQWMEQTTTRQVDEDEVPPHIRNKISRQERDVTPDFERELQMAI